MNRYRIAANFPSLKAHEAYQVVHVTANNWYMALRNGAKMLKSLPVLKKRRVKALSITIQFEGHIDPNNPDETQASNEHEDLQERLYPNE